MTNDHDSCSCPICRLRKGEVPPMPDLDTPPRSATHAMQRGAQAALAYFGALSREAFKDNPDPDAIPDLDAEIVAAIMAGSATVLAVLDEARDRAEDAANRMADSDPDAAAATLAALARARTH